MCFIKPPPKKEKKSTHKKIDYQSKLLFSISGKISISL